MPASPRLPRVARRHGAVPIRTPRVAPARFLLRPAATARRSPFRKPSGDSRIQGRRPRHGPASFSSWSKLRLGICPRSSHVLASWNVPLRAPASPAQSVPGEVSEGGRSPPPSQQEPGEERCRPPPGDLLKRAWYASMEGRHLPPSPSRYFFFFLAAFFF